MSGDEIVWVTGADFTAQAVWWMNNEGTSAGTWCQHSVRRPTPAGPKDRRCQACSAAISSLEADKRREAERAEKAAAKEQGEGSDE